MDAARFDALTRRLPGRLRLRLLGASLLPFAALPSLDLAGTEAKKKKKKCKKKCGECRKCKKGKCKPKPDGTLCGGGTCQSGVCETTGECRDAGVACAEAGVCCSERCGFSHGQGTCRQQDCKGDSATCTPSIPGHCCEGPCGGGAQNDGPTNYTCRTANCGGIGAACTSWSDCCAGQCGFTNGVGTCRASICKLPAGTSCSHPQGCCSGPCGCVGSTCTCRASTCQATGQTCSSSAQCCDGPCGCTSGGVCSCRSATCVGPGQPCPGGDVDCCTGICVVSQGSKTCANSV